MALLNVSMSSEFTQIPPISSTKPLFTLTNPLVSFPGHSSPQLLKCQIKSQENFLFSLCESVTKTSLLALVSASLFFVDPALAFKSILRQANFKGAKLLGASFFDADLTGADLSDADLRSADFSLANVTKANLSNANLEGALATGNTSFRGSNITGAELSFLILIIVFEISYATESYCLIARILSDFTDVPLRDDQREYLCKVADG
ncbi:Thylakoid lumenal 15 kDa protein 1 [Citrus sinensis]|uniref:Thylakoid lumenal 15 kDa protein 1 n=1 Tax=Citrus sinensis TaxID=2711 RepID=A0ACB8L0G5_CITSI|nr:Thylakoid lumenal 15 kDa protein 1 [Citrus sinensis]